MKVYTIQVNNVPNYNTSDFYKFYWLTPQKLVSKITFGDNAKEDFIKILPYLFTIK